MVPQSCLNFKSEVQQFETVIWSSLIEDKQVSKSNILLWFLLPSYNLKIDKNKNKTKAISTKSGIK